MNSLIPELRFPEFKDNWVRTQIENHFEFKNGLNKEKEYFGRGTPIINFMDVYKLHSIRLDDIKGLVELSNSEIERYSAKKGDVFFTRTSETIDDIGMSASLIEEIPNCVFSGFVLRARPTTNMFDSFFTSYLFNIRPVRKEIIKLAQGSTRFNMSKLELMKLKFDFPGKAEQQKIANFLSSIDKSIETITYQIKSTRKWKKGIMQKIFSQEIRFMDENGRNYPEWEERKLGDIGTTFNGLTGKTKLDFGAGKPYVQYMQIFSNSKIDTSNFGLVKIKSNESQNKVQYGDVFFTTSSETPNEIGTSSVLTEKVKEVYLNSFCFGYRPKSLNAQLPVPIG